MMNNIFIYIFTAIGLSMDAFSLALVYGINKISNQKIITLSLLVGIFHFFMPLLGSLFSNLFLRKILLNTNIIVGSIFLIISLEMFSSLKKEEKNLSLEKFYLLFLFSLTVSIDSLSIGIAYGVLRENSLLSSSIFFLVSTLFTYSVLKLGKYIGSKYSKTSTIIGAIIILLLSIKYFVN